MTGISLVSLENRRREGRGCKSVRVMNSLVWSKIAAFVLLGFKLTASRDQDKSPLFLRLRPQNL
ncbi:hypothetical protein PanWU01x14_221570 [Parasponia andersonii]|uniref:Uncharacterized protein n=1 Tax=Parasponia andersonii TaxID=3476 RepID=A0A2P5BPG3_PARAD|nr:hypothetical protein PanWU01x14_221570 [Parasponia andersonii]